MYSKNWSGTAVFRWKMPISYKQSFFRNIISFDKILLSVMFLVQAQTFGLNEKDRTRQQTLYHYTPMSCN